MLEPHSQFLSGRDARGTAQRAADILHVLDRPRPEVSEVAAVLLAHGEREPLRLSWDDLGPMQADAIALRAVFAAATTEEAADLLNKLLRAHAYPPRLTSHSGEFAWHLHVDSADDAPWAEWLLTSSCLALATLLAQWQRPPGGLCASASCGRPFVTSGSGSPRRYCSSRCATRERVAAHRRAGAN